MLILEYEDETQKYTYYSINKEPRIYIVITWKEKILLPYVYNARIMLVVVVSGKCFLLVWTLSSLQISSFFRWTHFRFRKGLFSLLKLNLRTFKKLLVFSLFKMKVILTIKIRNGRTFAFIQKLWTVIKMWVSVNACIICFLSPPV